MVPGAESARGLDLDHQGLACGRSGPVPRRRDDDPADANSRQVGLGAPGPVVVFDLGQLEPQRIAVGNRADGLGCGVARLGAAEVGRPASAGDAESSSWIATRS